MWYSVVRCFSSYAAFKGRAARREYWWFYPFVVLVNVPVYAVVGAAPRLGIALSWLWAALFIVPFLAVMSRRLHDTGHSQWWAGAPVLAMCPVLLAELFAPPLLKGNRLMAAGFVACLLGFLVLAIRCLLLLCSRGTAGPNRYGDPAAAISS